jgi:hypothetical protein
MALLQLFQQLLQQEVVMVERELQVVQHNKLVDQVVLVVEEVEQMEHLQELVEVELEMILLYLPLKEIMEELHL